jgi:hypothetical protein
LPDCDGRSREALLSPRPARLLRAGEDYLLRVGEIIADNRVPAGQQLRNQRLDETEVAPARCVSISELPPQSGVKSASEDLAAGLALPAAGTGGVVDQEVFESIYIPGKLLLLASWTNREAAEQWTPARFGPDRREAPQYYPSARRHRSTT